MTNEELKTLYISGKNSTEIAAILGISVSATTERLRRVNTPMRTRSERRRIYKINHNCFDKPTKESLYFAGLLMADGYITKKNGHINGVGIEVHEKDGELLEAFKLFMNYTGAINTRVRKHKNVTSIMHVLQVTSKEIGNKLEDYGVIPNKTGVAQVPNWIKESHLAQYFFRGLFDGDGCVGIRKGVHFNGKLFSSLCGSPNVVTSFQDWTEKEIGARGATMKRTFNTWVVQYSHYDTQKLGFILYNSEVTSLSRKKKLFLENTINAN